MNTLIYDTVIEEKVAQPWANHHEWEHSSGRGRVVEDYPGLFGENLFYYGTTVTTIGDFAVKKAFDSLVQGSQLIQGNCVQIFIL